MKYIKYLKAASSVAVCALLLTSCGSLRDLKVKLHGGDLGENDEIALPAVSYSASPDSHGIASELALRRTGEGENAEYSLEKYNGSDTEVLVPAVIGTTPMTEIFANAFGENDNITSVVLQSGMRKIGNYAFYSCKKLTSVSIPSSVSHIGAKAFAGCTSLSAVNLPKSVKEIGEGAFEGCTGLSEMLLSGAITRIPDRAFGDCTALTYIYIPKAMTTIERGAFEGCTALARVDIFDRVTYIADDAFEGCENISFLCTKGSYAENYAMEKGFKVIYHTEAEEQAAALLDEEVAEFEEEIEEVTEE